MHDLGYDARVTTRVHIQNSRAHNAILLHDTHTYTHINIHTYAHTHTHIDIYGDRSIRPWPDT